MTNDRADGGYAEPAVYISDLWVLDPRHFRFTAVLFGREIEIRACLARWNGCHVVDVLPPFSVLPSGRRRAQIRWGESLCESIRVAVEIAIAADLECKEGAQ